MSMSRMFQQQQFAINKLLKIIETLDKDTKFDLSYVLDELSGIELTVKEVHRKYPYDEEILKGLLTNIGRTTKLALHYGKATRQ